jgi:hypothetical protein
VFGNNDPNNEGPRKTFAEAVELCKGMQGWVGSIENDKFNDLIYRSYQ